MTVARPTPPPGEEAPIDYGYLGTWFDPAAGRRRRVWAFSMVLAHSRLLFVRPVVVMDHAAWVDAHVAAFDVVPFALPRRCRRIAGRCAGGGEHRPEKGGAAAAGY